MFVVMPITIILSVRFIERLAKAGRRYVTVPMALMLLKVVVGTEINYVYTMNKEKFDKGDYKVPEIERLDPASVPAAEGKEYTPFSNANSDSVPF